MKRKPAIIGVILGIVYGLLIRLLVGMSDNDLFEFMTLSFIFITPAIIGGITVSAGTKEQRKSWKFLTFMPWVPIAGFLLITLITYLEATICIVMLLPVFLLLSSVGGHVAGNLKARSKNKLNIFLLLPLLVSPIEEQISNSSETNVIVTDIVINADQKLVWENIKSVDSIKKSELTWSFSHFIGIPVPIQSNLNEEKIGGVRRIKWDKGIRFREILTSWEHQKSFEYDIIVDTIPPDAFDEHIKVGGEYFKILTGGYSLEPIDSKTTKLKLFCKYKISSKFNFYCKFWGDWILDDFQRVILNVIKNRCEEKRSQPLTEVKTKQAGGSVG